ncbi:hypothetical protein EK21DRAFT_54135, partial [Setomelanomma holmii]
VHKLLLRHHSEYFRNASRGPWKEAQGAVIRLQDIDEDADIELNIFVHWLYTEQLPAVDNPKCDEILKNSGSECDLLSKLKAYILADRLAIPAFRRAIKNSFVDGVDNSEQFW